ncbi:hypothetical protein CRUP_022733 [Coryphaenoides rupestris]|nr:hypothetical protein CRUP_022733 [Coryphaenoides rupestris]
MGPQMSDPTPEDADPELPLLLLVVSCTCGGFEEDSGTSSPSNECEVDAIALSDIRIPGGAPLSALNSAHQSENGDSDPPPPRHLMAVHLLVSAMEALPDETLSSLSECSPETLQAIDQLIRQLRGSGHPLPANSVPIIGLEEDAKTWMFSERLLCSSRVTLKRETDGGLWAETGSEAGQLPLHHAHI